MEQLLSFVCSPDNDVLFLLWHHQSNLHWIRLYMFTGHTEKHSDLSRFIPIHQLCNVLSENQVQIMLQVYWLTGCDTTSGLFSEGQIDGRMYAWTDKDCACRKITLNKSCTVLEVQFLWKSMQYRTHVKTNDYIELKHSLPFRVNHRLS